MLTCPQIEPFVRLCLDLSAASKAPIVIRIQAIEPIPKQEK